MGKDDDMQNFKKRCQTNGDKIRAMTDEQLAKMFIRISELPPIWKKHFLDWLKKEA